LAKKKEKKKTKMKSYVWIPQKTRFGHGGGINETAAKGKKEVGIPKESASRGRQVLWADAVSFANGRGQGEAQKEGQPR